MTNLPTFDTLYASLINFLLVTKQQLIMLGGENGLTGVQTHALLMLYWHGSRPMNSLCNLLGCDPSYITGITDSLEKKGLIQRTGKQGDRRVKVLAMQPAGKAVCQRMLKQLAEKNRRMLAEFDQQELATFSASLQKLTQANRDAID